MLVTPRASYKYTRWTPLSNSKHLRPLTTFRHIFVITSYITISNGLLKKTIKSRKIIKRQSLIYLNFTLGIASAKMSGNFSGKIWEKNIQEWTK